MPSRVSSCVVGIDVGGTNTDAVVLQNDQVLAWHKTHTTRDIQSGVENAIEAVMTKGNISAKEVQSVKIGTTQFVNAVLEQDASKLDKVAVIRLCGPYSRGTPPFVDFPPKLRSLMEGHVGYVDGGLQVDGTPISPLDASQLQEQALTIASKNITSIVVIGIYSPSDPSQEERARLILASYLGPEYDISCSHSIGRLGFLERENAAILNGSLRRFARHVISGFSHSLQSLGSGKLYITLNDGTLSRASEAAEYPVRCFSSGPTNSARGAALLAKVDGRVESDDNETLVIDVGGTTTDICSLLKSGYPRQSAAFVKIAGVRTNFTIPDVHSIALGGGSLVRTSKDGRTSVGPDSVGARVERESIVFGGNVMTATDLVLQSDRTKTLVPRKVRESGLREMKRAIEEAVDVVKTKSGDIRAILVGGGSIIIGNQVAGVEELIRPKYFEVANAVGAAIGRISGVVDTVVIPGTNSIEQEFEKAKVLATQRCIAAGGMSNSIEVVDVEILPMSYVTNGAMRLVVRVVGDLRGEAWKQHNVPDLALDAHPRKAVTRVTEFADTGILESDTLSKGDTYSVIEHVDLETYRPRIEGDIWYLSETDLAFLVDGVGVLGVGSMGEPYPSYLACLHVLQNGGQFKIRRHQSLSDEAVVLAVGFMGAPSVYLERIPGLEEITEAMQTVMDSIRVTSFDAVIPYEIGGLNALEALLAGQRSGKCTLDTDCVARAFPKMFQSIRCLKDVSVTPSAVADGRGGRKLFMSSSNNINAEDMMREACVEFGSLAGFCVNPLSGTEAKGLPQNSYSHAWSIGRTIAMARSQKKDIVASLLECQNGVCLFTGKIVSVRRNVAEGFTRGSVLLEQTSLDHLGSANTSLYVEFENENLVAILKTRGSDDRVVACCPDLITFLDMANGAPLGISDYKYGLRVSVIALEPPQLWTSERGLEVGGPRAFGLDMDYRGVSVRDHHATKSVIETFGEEKCFNEPQN